MREIDNKYLNSNLHEIPGFKIVRDALCRLCLIGSRFEKNEYGAQICLILEL